MCKEMPFCKKPCNKLKKKVYKEQHKPEDDCMDYEEYWSLHSHEIDNSVDYVFELCEICPDYVE